MKQILGLTFISVLLAGCSALPFLGKKQAALQVNSTPSASVYLNGNRVGQTPYFDDKLKPGEYEVKLAVDNDPAKEWSTKATLSPQIVTVISRLFGATAEESSSYLLQLEPLPTKTSSELSIITIPDNVIVKIDGEPNGFSPVSVKDIAEGDHTVSLTAPGYQDLTVQAQTKKGYKLIVSATLARATAGSETPPIATESATLSPTPASALTPTPSSKVTPKPSGKITPTPSKKVTPTPSKTNSTTASGSAQLARPYVTILQTPTGWLRVRSAPNDLSDNEVAKVNPGEQYKFIESNDSGWYQIEYQPGETGWISAKYATLYK